MYLFVIRLLFFVDFRMTIILILTSQVTASLEKYPILKVSQCFKSRIIPKVEFSCPSSNQMIRIVRSFHGLHPNQGPCAISDEGSVGDKILGSTTDPACSYCEGDCVDDSINEVYDWSSCVGRTSCIRTVLQSYIHSCQRRDKFSEYLHVEYQCIPRETAVNICSDTKRVTSAAGDLTSPNYPLSYPANQDCMCTLRADDPSVNVVLSFYDLFLETKNDRCRADWLMLLQDGEKHRHCGVITSGAKNITSINGQVSLQFHTNAEDHVMPVAITVNSLSDTDKSAGNQYKGFWVHFEAEDKKSTMNIVCRTLKPNDPALLDARLDELSHDVTDNGRHRHNDVITDGDRFSNQIGQMFGHGQQSDVTSSTRFNELDRPKADEFNISEGTSSSTRPDTIRTTIATEAKIVLPVFSSSVPSTGIHCLRLLFFCMAFTRVVLYAWV